MADLEKYLDEAKEVASDAGRMAKTIAGEVAGRAKKLTEEGGAVREFAKNAKEQAAAVSLGVSEKVQDALQDSRAGRELRQGIAELESMPEIEGSILYTMEHETAVSYLRSLILIIEDKRMDTASAIEEIRQVIGKIESAAGEQDPESEEQQAVEKARSIVFDACIRALDALSA